MKRNLSHIVGLFVLWAASGATYASTNSAFTIQALLADGGTPVNGSIDIRAELFETPMGGMSIAGPVQLNGIGVIDGLLTTTVDFGPEAFCGTSQYLELSVRNPADPMDTQPFTLLNQRIQITHAPKSLAANKASALVVPATLSLNDASNTTLTVENSAPGSTAMNVLGRMTVGDQEQIVLGGTPGEILAQGSVTASGLTTAGDAYVHGHFFVGPEFFDPRLAVDGPTGSLFIGPDLNTRKFIVDGSNGNLFIGPDQNTTKFKVDGTTGTLRIGADLNTPKFDVNGTLGDLSIGPNVLANNVKFKVDATNGDVHVKGAYFDSADSAGEASATGLHFLASTMTGTRWERIPVLDANGNLIATGNGNQLGTAGGNNTITGNLRVRPAPAASPTFDVDATNGSLTIGPSTPFVAKFFVDGDDGSLRIGPSAFAGRERFSVEGDNGTLRIGDFTAPKLKFDANTANLSIDGVGVAFESQARFRVVGASGDVHVRGAYFDSNDSPGDPAMGHFLASTGTGTQWRSIPVIDANGNLIATGNNNRLGTAGGQNNIVGDFMVRPDAGSSPNFEVFGSDGSVFVGGDSDNAKLQIAGVDGSLFIGPGTESRKFTVSGVDGRLSIGPDSSIFKFHVDADQNLLMGPDVGAGDVKFQVDAANGDVHVEGAYFDSDDFPGEANPGGRHFLTSTMTGTRWERIPILDDNNNLITTGNSTLGNDDNDKTNITGRGCVTYGGSGDALTVTTSLTGADGVVAMVATPSDLGFVTNGGGLFGGNLRAGAQPKFGAYTINLSTTAVAGDVLTLGADLNTITLMSSTGGGGPDGSFVNLTVTDDTTLGNDSTDVVVVNGTMNNDVVIVRGNTTLGDGSTDALIVNATTNINNQVQIIENSETFQASLTVETNPITTPGKAGIEVFNGGMGTFNDGVRVLTFGGRAVSAQGSGPDAGGVNAFTFSSTAAAIEANNPNSAGNALLAGGNACVTGNVKISGDLEVTGSVSKGGGSFRIDHPLDPANKYLYHSFVESSDMMNIYNGVAITDAQGYATVTLPDWFDAVNRDYRYQLTVIDESNSDDFILAKVIREVENNEFTIRTSLPNVRVSWQVTGIRQDGWANANRIPVEEWKAPGDRGKYLHPLENGMPEEVGFAYEGKLRMLEAKKRADNNLAEYEAAQAARASDGSSR